MIDLATAKAHLRVVTSDEDGIIGTYLGTAQSVVQTLTGKKLVLTAVTQNFAGFPGASPWCRSDRPIELTFGPVDGTTAALTVAYDDENGVEQTLTDFRLVEGSSAKLLPSYGSYWPTAQRAAGSVRIGYSAGYATDEVPPELDQAVLYLVGHYFENRNAVEAGLRAAAVEIPMGVQDLIAPYRAPGIF